MAKNRRQAIRMAAEDLRGSRVSENPFTKFWQPEIILKQKRIDLDKKPAFDEAGNRLTGKLLVPYERDGERFLKLVRRFLYEQVLLSNTAKKVLLFVMHQVLPGNAVAWLPADEAADFCRFKQKQSFHAGITELILYEYLARTEKVGFYFINPRKFFNGDRTGIKSTFSKPRESFTPTPDE